MYNSHTQTNDIYVTAKTVLANMVRLYNITVEILRALTIKLTQARARTRAMPRDRDMARNTDRPRLRARARAWECVYV